MKCTIFTAADYVDSSSGKLVIVGAFDNIDAKECPHLFKPFGVAIKLIAEAKDMGKKYDTHLILRRERNRKPIADIPVPMRFSEPTEDKINSIIVALNIIGTRFEKFGSYIFELKAGKSLITSTKIRVVKITGKSKP
jgi:hypothetical protein